MSDPIPFGKVKTWLKIEVTEEGEVFVHGKIGRKPFEAVAEQSRVDKVLDVVGQIVKGTYTLPQ